jgi:hypothetical protein
MRKIELFKISEGVYKQVGELALLFSHVEWLIANVLLLSKVSASDYSKIKDLPVVQEHFETLLAMGFGRKVEKLSEEGFDVSKLKSVGIYRNTLSHGLIFRDGDAFTVKKITEPKKQGVALHSDELTKNIEMLKEEGGKLLDFIEGKGYKYYEPK